MDTNIFHYHQDSRTAERWSIERKYQRMQPQLKALEMAVANVLDNAPSEYSAPLDDPA